MSDYDMSIHSNPDARAWAKFFCQTVKSAPVDEELMIGWFANAMMAMHDHIHQQRKPLTRDQRAAVAAAWRDGNGTASEIIDLVEAAHGIKEKNNG